MMKDLEIIKEKKFISKMPDFLKLAIKQETLDWTLI